MQNVKKYEIKEVISYLEKDTKTKEEKEYFKPQGFRFPLGFGRGMDGFSMKALLIPESIHILVSPVGCGRHSDIEVLGSGEDIRRIYRIWLTENDIVVGSVNRVKKKVLELIDSMEKKPKAVTLNVTCLDALLNTDYSEVGIELEKRYGIRFGYIRMFPFLQESRKTHGMMLMEFQYSLIRKTIDKKNKFVNIIGNTKEISLESDFSKIMKEAGYQVLEIRSCKTIEEYDQMGTAKLNVVLNKHTVPAAKMMEKKYGIPYVEFFECMDPEKIKANYKAVEQKLNCKLNYEKYYLEALEKKKQFATFMKGKTAAVGGGLDYNPIKCASEVAMLGLDIKYVWVSEFRKSDLVYYEKMLELGQTSDLYLMTDYSMKNWKLTEETKVDVVIGLASLLLMGVYGPRYMFLKEEPYDFETFISAINTMIHIFNEGNNFGGTQKEKNIFDRDWGIYQ